MKLVRLVGVFVLLTALEPSYAQTSRVSKEQLQELFDSISEHTDWDISGDMTWAYFFTDADKSALERVASILDERDYLIKGIYLSDEELGDEPDVWSLHVEKVETHSVDSLNATNLAFHAFAEKHHLDSYDGPYVKPVEASD
ncbi:MAG: ribonuclease E inhibitor RraB [Pseudomonadota bacterium]